MLITTYSQLLFPKLIMSKVQPNPIEQSEIQIKYERYIEKENN